MARLQTPSGPLLVVIGAIIATGCASVKPTCKVPTAVEVELETSDRVNRDEAGQSLPTVVRLYQLRNANSIQMASFEDVWEDPEAALGDNLLDSQELTIFPGQIVVHNMQRNEGADYLAAVAIFRRPVGQSWYSLQEWPLPGDPCKEREDPDVQPKLELLRVRAFIRDYRVESVNNYMALAKRRCPAGEVECSGASGGAAPDELQDAKRRRRLRTFEEDPSAPQPTVGPGAAADAAEAR